MSWVFRTMIVPAARAALARELCDKIPPGDSGKGMFVRPLAPGGAGTATHYMSSGLIQQDMADLMGNANMAYAAAQSVGIVTTLADVTALLTESDISEDAPATAMGRVGIQFVAAL